MQIQVVIVVELLAKQAVEQLHLRIVKYRKRRDDGQRNGTLTRHGAEASRCQSCSRRSGGDFHELAARGFVHVPILKFSLYEMLWIGPYAALSNNTLIVASER